MFESLSDRLGDVFGKLRKRGALNEKDVDAALREVRVALLEADVALAVVKDFVRDVRKEAIGQEITRSVSPGQMVVKLVNDQLVRLLGEESEAINLDAAPPVPIMMVGLQGSGKTTSTAKLALRLKTRDKKKVLMASLDVRRPAAQEQLKVLGEQADIPTLPVVPGQMPVEIAKRAMQAARLQGFDAVILDTAGRLHVDEQLMSETAAVRDAVGPHETLLVADALTGQDAVNVAGQFDSRLGLTGILLTRADGDGRGGAALSMRAVTGRPIKLMGVGEKLDALEGFHPERIANRILGMGDVVGLVEKAQDSMDEEEAKKLARKMKKGNFDLEDLRGQLRQMQKMGGLEGLAGMLPGAKQMKQQLANANVDPRMLKRQEAIIGSMTPRERRHPKLINASRKKRIAAGAGVQPPDVNRVLKQWKQMNVMMKKVRKMGKAGMMRAGLEGILPRM